MVYPAQAILPVEDIMGKMCIGIPNWPVIFWFWCCSTIEFMVKSHVLRIQSRFLPFFHTLCLTAFIYQSASRWVYFVLQTILSWFYKCIWLVVSNILFSISYMGCHPKPIWRTPWFFRWSQHQPAHGEENGPMSDPMGLPEGKSPMRSPGWFFEKIRMPWSSVKPRWSEETSRPEDDHVVVFQSFEHSGCSRQKCWFIMER
jgi:hypothetical protein